MAFSKVQMHKAGIKKQIEHIRILEKHGYDCKHQKIKLERAKQRG